MYYLIFNFFVEQGNTKFVELDIFIPELALSFEYHGEYHYQFVPIHDDIAKVQQRDQSKQEICKSRGISLIVIPFWWDKYLESLSHTIHKYRPDIIPNTKSISGEAIPDSIPFQRPYKVQFYPARIEKA